ncbi:hypothetical protein JQV19_02870 [Sulfitobacter mediterraneus]|nr:hypothetical protein [Sulfitobacter mediterraneus]MBM1555318.1 hypothetical protein [Sulfitobacter mediterraneus]MBM1567129.1 hypothetical protein [Sulfitobacter mediterraneus]MBM1570931.1 hypothetical protein [Sulfitobacter mediterraneus]MBM1574731.1 hypothetical protein [Sulfitobacter mediterraneus]MBM1578276.1 hypothetical protein [Sulfitobacter mediterraneus]
MAKRSKPKKTSPDIEYRETVLPGIGRIKVPAHLSDDDILKEIRESDSQK